MAFLWVLPSWGRSAEQHPHRLTPEGPSFTSCLSGAEMTLGRAEAQGSFESKGEHREGQVAKKPCCRDPFTQQTRQRFLFETRSKNSAQTHPGEKLERSKYSN